VRRRDRPRSRDRRRYYRRHRQSRLRLHVSSAPRRNRHCGRGPRPAQRAAARQDDKESVVTHANAPLSIEGRRRLVERCKTRPITHVAAEMGISRTCASKWVNRWRRHGDAGLQDRSSTPHRSPRAPPAWVLERIETWRREHKWSANRITYELVEFGFSINRRTVTRHLTQLGLGRRRFIDPGGESNRKPGKINAHWPGHMVHLDV